MIKRLSFIVISALIFSSCKQNTEEKQVVNVADSSKQTTVVKNDCSEYLKKAQQADNVLLSATNFNKADAENAITAFYNYVAFCTKDTLAPVYLLKAGQVAQSIGNYNKAKEFFYMCIENYVDFKNRGAAMFLLAQLYDTPNMLNNEEEAKGLYERIIKEYPKTNFAIDAKACLSNLGKTDEQLIQEFLKKNK